MAELADALDLGSSGRPCGFESHYPYHVGAKYALLRRFLFNTKGNLPSEDCLFLLFSDEDQSTDTYRHTDDLSQREHFFVRQHTDYQ